MADVKNELIFRQLFDYDTWTYSYLLADSESREGVFIDTVKERGDRDLKLLKELGLNLKFLLDTHVHADHVTGAARLRGTRIPASAFFATEWYLPVMLY